MLLKQLLRSEAVKGEVVALDKHSRPSLQPEKPRQQNGEERSWSSRWKGRKGFILGYKVHTACYTSSELPLAFTVAPCNMNEKRCFKRLLKKLKNRGISFKTVVAEASTTQQGLGTQWGSTVLNQPYRRCSKIKNALRVARLRSPRS